MHRLRAFALSALVISGFFATLQGLALPVDRIKLPSGFHIAVYTEQVPGARSMALGSQGTVFVGTRKSSVYAVRDINGDNRAESVTTALRGLKTPNGLAFREGSLYVAEIDRVLRYDRIEEHLNPMPVVLNASFPSDRHHGWKFIRFGPDGLLYVPVGAPCNVCERPDQRYATIMRMRPDGTNLEIFAQGIRNTVGFDWHPETGELWFTDNGRDWMGDNRPPDELNRAPSKNLHFGFPYVHGRYIKDPKFGKDTNPDDYVAPAVELGPHVAALGMRFYTGEMFPDEYRNQIFIAEHGSWNRSIPIGYRITLVRSMGGETYSYRVFAEGWLENQKPWGRPVDILQMPDGALLVSDDHAGALYRISYQEE